VLAAPGVVMKKSKVIAYKEYLVLVQELNETRNLRSAPVAKKCFSSFAPIKFIQVRIMHLNFSSMHKILSKINFLLFQ
jgi:hypothetical protein